MSEQEPRYASDEEAAMDGFHPDPDPAEDIQHHAKDDADVPGPMPIVVEGVPFEAKSGTITVADEVLELPPEIRQTAQVVELGKDGELHGRPATPSERGGGIKTDKTAETFTRTHHKASHK